MYASIKYQASKIEYNDTPLNEVLDDLYSKTNSLAVNLMNFETNYAIYAEDIKNGVVRSINLTEGDYTNCAQSLIL